MGARARLSARASRGEPPCLQVGDELVLSPRPLPQRPAPRSPAQPLDPPRETQRIRGCSRPREADAAVLVLGALEDVEPRHTAVDVLRQRCTRRVRTTRTSPARSRTFRWCATVPFVRPTASASSAAERRAPGGARRSAARAPRRGRAVAHFGDDEDVVGLVVGQRQVEETVDGCRNIRHSHRPLASELRHERPLWACGAGSGSGSGTSARHGVDRPRRVGERQHRKCDRVAVHVEHVHVRSRTCRTPGGSRGRTAPPPCRSQIAACSAVLICSAPVKRPDGIPFAMNAW